MTTGEQSAFGVLLKRYRVAAGLTQEALAQRASLSTRAVSDLERGVNKTPRHDTLDLLAAALALSPHKRALWVTAARPQAGPAVAIPARENSPHNLPAQSTVLIGREAETAAACDILRRGDVRLLTLTGPGGVGKTRLALQVAEDLLDRYDDGVFFVDLAAITDPDLVAPTIARILGLREVASRTPRDTLIDYLRDRQILLLLDNFEQVASAAPLAADLLAACPRLELLVTSRAPVHVRGEHEFPVSPLAAPDPAPGCADARLITWPSVDLFVQRARAVNPTWTLTAANAPAVAEICRRLDGLPLAIELAAARVKLLPPQDLLPLLARRLTLLTSGGWDVPARQQTLRHTFAWSYDLLDEREKALFRRLAVFVGGCTRAAIASVSASIDDTIEDTDPVTIVNGLTSLADKSLLRSLPVPDPQDMDATRFTMLETVREYGLERLAASDELERARKAQAAYALDLAEQAAMGLLGAEQSLWLARLDREHDNMRAALDWARERGELEHGLRLAGALWRFWYTRGYLVEGRERLEGLLALATPNGPTVAASVRATALYRAAVLTAEQGDYDRAMTLAEESAALHRTLDDAQGLIAALTVLGNVARYQSNYDRAVALFEQVLDINRDSGDKTSSAVTLNNLGSVAHTRGDYNRATRLYEESLAIKRALGDKRGIANTLNNLGTVARDRGASGDSARAVELYQESLAFFRESGDKRGVANALNNLSVVVCDEGDTVRAGALCAESLALRRELGDKGSIAYSLVSLGRVTQARGDDERAQACYKEGLALGHDVGYRDGIAPGLEGVAAIAYTCGQGERAARLYGAASALRETIGAPLPPVDRPAHECIVANVRGALGAAAFTAAWTEGRRMDVGRAIAIACDAAILAHTSG